MKKNRVLSVAVTVCLMLGMLAVAPMQAHAAAPVKVYVNDKLITFDVEPYIDAQGRTMVPVRFVTEAMGATVEWDGATQTATMTRGKVNVKLTIGKKDIQIMMVTKKKMDTVPVLAKGGRTIVPLRFVSEAFGAEVTWDAKTRSAYIKDSGKDCYRSDALVIPIDEGDEFKTTGEGLFAMMKKSGLLIEEDSISKDGGYAIVMDIIDYLPEEFDAALQRQQVRALIRQVASEKLTNEIMSYAASKKTLMARLDFKIWNEGRFEFWVSCDIGATNVAILMK